MYDALYEIKGNKAPNSAEIEIISKMIESLVSILVFADKYSGDSSLSQLSFDAVKKQLESIISLSETNNIEDIERMTKMMVALADASNALRYYASGDQISDALEEMLYDSELMGKLKTSGETISGKLAEGINDDVALSNISAAMISLMNNLAESMATDAFYDTLSLNEVLSSMLDDAENADISEIIGILDSKITEMGDAGESGEWSFRDVGFYLAAGLAAGVSSGTYLIESACRRAVAAARVAAMEEADESSPSKVFMEIGKYMSEGTAIGIQNGTGAVQKASEEMINAARTGAEGSTGSSLSLWARLFGMDVEDNPTITPIVDMTNIDLAAQNLNDLLFGERKLELSADGNKYARESVPGYDRGTNEYKAPDLSSIRESIASLGNRIDGVATAVSHMQVVLNTGGLVGAVTDGVNKNLGAKTTYRRRRN